MNESKTVYNLERKLVILKEMLANRDNLSQKEEVDMLYLSRDIDMLCDKLAGFYVDDL